jgi:hypothetical protein
LYVIALSRALPTVGPEGQGSHQQSKANTHPLATLVMSALYNSPIISSEASHILHHHFSCCYRCCCSAPAPMLVLQPMISLRKTIIYTQHPCIPLLRVCGCSQLSSSLVLVPLSLLLQDEHFLHLCLQMAGSCSSTHRVTQSHAAQKEYCTAYHCTPPGAHYLRRRGTEGGRRSAWQPPA